jgi:hypothetical protein
MTGWRGGVKYRLGLQIRTQARRLVRAHLASQLGIVQPASVTQRPGTIWTPTPFWCFGSVTAVATTRRGRLLKKNVVSYGFQG